MTRFEDRLKELSDTVASSCKEIADLRSVVLTKNDLETFTKNIVTAVKEELKAEFDKNDVEISQLKNKLVIYESVVEDVKSAQNKAEQYSRRVSLRMNGVPKKQGQGCQHFAKKKFMTNSWFLRSFFGLFHGFCERNSWSLDDFSQVFMVFKIEIHD